MIDCCFLEVENPMKFDDRVERKKHLRDLGFWQKSSVRTIEVVYFRPPMQEGRDIVDSQMLNVIVCSPKLKTTSIPKEAVLNSMIGFLGIS
jgi:hypothetical protein